MSRQNDVPDLAVMHSVSATAATGNRKQTAGVNGTAIAAGMTSVSRDRWKIIGTIRRRSAAITAAETRIAATTAAGGTVHPMRYRHGLEVMNRTATVNATHVRAG